jgi:hypothetical protein
VAAGSTNPDDAIFTFSGSIVYGRLILDTGAASVLPVVPASAAAGFAMNVHAVRLRANLTSAGLTNGNFGGYLDGSELRDTACAATPAYCAVLSGAVGGLVDLQSLGICEDTTTTPPTLGNIGAGYGLRAVPAVIAGVGNQAPGTCGYSAPDASSGG